MLFAAALCLWAARSPATDAPSFSCAKPTAIEAAICGNPALAAKDRTMAELFQAAKTSALGVGPSNELPAQRAWLKRRGTVCGGDSLANCLSEEYDQRLGELAIATLFSAPDAALRELRRQDKNTALFYESIADDVTMPRGKARDRKLVSDIKPVFDDLAAANMTSGAPAIADTPEGVIANDKSFSDFIALASTQQITKLGAPLVLPCAALNRRHGLFDALGSRYGSVVDSQLPQSDCARTLPPTPSLNRLIDAAAPDPKFCTGSVRFSTYPDFLKAMDSVRLNMPAGWRRYRPRHGEQPGLAHFRTSHAALWSAAVAEMSQYVETYFHASPPAAMAEAQDAVETLAGMQHDDICE